MTDPVSLAKMRILHALISPAYISVPEILQLVAANMVDLSFRYGNSDESPFGYSTFGVILCSVMGDIRRGYLFSKTAVELLACLNTTRTRGRTLYSFNGYIRHFHDYLHDSIAGLEEAYLACMQCGDLEFAGRCLTMNPRYSFLSGEKLAVVAKALQTSRRLVEKSKQQTSLIFIRILQQCVDNLMRCPADPWVLKGKYVDEAAMMPFMERTGNQHGIFLLSFNKLLISCIFRNHKEALDNANRGAAAVDSSPGKFNYLAFFGYDSLARLAVFDSSSAPERQNILARVKENQARLELWARFAPANHLHRWHLVEAETARVQGDDPRAVYHIAQACELSAASACTYEEALAWELAAEIHGHFQRPRLVRTCIKEALSKYLRWGASAKVKWLKERYPFLNETNYTDKTTSRPIDQLDTRSIVRASQALSEEIRLPQLVETLMEIVLESAGAQCGALMIAEDSELTVYARATLEDRQIKVFQPGKRTIDSSFLPVGIINYVSRSREKMILDHAIMHPMLAADTYVQTRRPLSILCMPLLRQNRLMAVLYLENSLVSGAFTAEIVAILELITSQAAISIENAMLYADLQASENRFRAVFQQTFQSIGLLGPDGTLLAANKSSLDMIGFQNPDSLIGHAYWETPWWSHSSEIQERLRQSIVRAAAGEMDRFETSHTVPGGNLHYMDFSIKPVKDEQGRVVMLIPEGRDITERKQFEEALRASEEKYRTIFENTGTANIIVEDDSTISLVNSRFSDLIGYTPEEIEGKMKWMTFTHEPQTGTMRRYHRGRRTPGRSWPSSYEFDFVNRSGEYRKALMSVAMIPGTSQSVAVIIDMSEKQRIEAEKLRLEKLLSNIIDSMPSSVITIDKGGLVKQWNAAAEYAFGLRAQDAMDQHISQLHPDASLITRELDIALRKGLVQTVEKMPVFVGKRKSYVNITIYPLTDVDVQGAVIRIDDVTEKVKLDETIIQSEKMMSVGGLAAGMAHEINNPLSGIIQSVQNICRRLDWDLPANQAVAAEIGLDLQLVSEYFSRRHVGRMLNGIKDSGVRASFIVRNMLQFSRKPQSEKTWRSVEDLLERALELASSDYDLKKHYDFRHIEIVREYDPAGAGAVSCSESEIEQVLLNVLKNAAQAMHSQTGSIGRPRLVLRAYRDDYQAVIEIADNGPGMEESVRRRIFEPFFTTKATGEGTGLGLSVAYFIITQNHGGQMSVESSSGQGACFTIKLPLV